MDVFRVNLKIAEIITKELTVGPALTFDEKQHLNVWISESEDHRKLYEKLSGGELYFDFEQVISDTEQTMQWKKLNLTIRHERRRKIARWCSYAALITVFILGGGYCWTVFRSKPMVDYPPAYIAPGIRQAVLILNNGEQIRLDAKDTLLSTDYSNIKIKSGQIKYNARQQVGEAIVEDTMSCVNRVIVPRGGIYSLVLSDGSKVFLNAESELVYPMQFRGNTREVILKGEAFFEVSPDAGQPFIVKTGTLMTKVLGTVFNIKAYGDEPEIQTTLLQGSVEVSVANTPLKEILQPGELASWSAQGNSIEVRNVNSHLASGWKDGIIMLSDDDLESVLRMLCRWYDVEYVFDGPISGTHTFTGRIDRNEDLGSVLRTLTLLGGPSFRVEQKVIHVLDKK